MYPVNRQPCDSEAGHAMPGPGVSLHRLRWTRTHTRDRDPYRLLVVRGDIPAEPGGHVAWRRELSGRESERFEALCHWVGNPGGDPMHQSRGNIGQTIAREARACEERRTKHGRKWVAVFLNEDTIVIALHGSLTAAEKALARSPAGAAKVRDYHRRLFANASATLRRKVKSVTGMEVRDTTAEIEPATGSVVHLLTTDAVGFPPASRGPAKTRVPDTDCSAGTKVVPAAKPIQPDV